MNLTKDAELARSIPGSQGDYVRHEGADDIVTWEVQCAEEQRTEPKKTNPTEATEPQMISTHSTIEEPAITAQAIHERPTQPLNSATRIVTPSEETVTPETIIAEPESERVRVLKADYVEIVAVVEEYLPRTNRHHEAEAHKEEGSSIDLLGADPRDDAQTIEAEHVEDSEASLLTDYDEAPAMDEDGSSVRNQPVLINVVEAQEYRDNSSKDIDLGLEEFSFYMETLEPSRAEAVKDIIVALSAAIEESQSLVLETSDEEKEDIEQGLALLCAQLFKSLDIEYDNEIVKQFIKNIGAFEPVTDVNIETGTLFSGALNRMGTHEYKPAGSSSLLSGLTRFIKQTLQPHLTMGRYALRAYAI